MRLKIPTAAAFTPISRWLWKELSGLLEIAPGLVKVRCPGPATTSPSWSLKTA
jgi:hypothetical protein